MSREKGRTLSDDELIKRVRAGDDRAVDILMEKYKGLVRHRAKSMYILGGDSDDLIQEGMIGLFKAIRDYDPGRDASFQTFAQLCTTRQMYSAVTSYGRKKHQPLNTAVSLNMEVPKSGSDGSEDNSMPLMDTVAASADSDPEEYLIERESLEQLEEKIETELSPFEKQVLELHLTGMGYVEIAHVLGRDEKSTDNALQRIRKKLRR